MEQNELNEDLKFLLELKFNTILEMVEAFKESISAPKVFASDPGVEESSLMHAITLWAQEGAPDKFEINEKNVDLILTVKFGSMEQAYREWKMQTNPSVYNNLSDLEYVRLLDYVPEPS